MGVAAPLILLTGASGQIGLFALARLATAGRDILAVNRSGHPPPFVPRWPGVIWAEPRDIRERVGTRDARLLSAGPLELADEAIGMAPGVERVIAFSTTSVTVKAASADPAERAVIERIVAVESRLSRQALVRGIPLLLLRPTLVWGAGLDDNLSRAARWIRRYGMLPISGRGRGLRQPVHADDLARTAVRAVLADEVASLDAPVVGADTLSYRDMMAAVFDALDRPPRMVGVPEGVLVTAVQVAGMLRLARGVSPEMVRRQNRDLVFDDRLARERLGHAPRPFAPTAADFEPLSAERLQEVAKAQASLR